MDCGQMNDCAIRLPSEDDKWLQEPLQKGARPVCQKFSYPDYTSGLNLKDIEFPMALTQIKKLENLNISINVYCIEKKK